MPIEYNWGDQTWVTRRKEYRMLPSSEFNKPYDFTRTYPDIRAALMAIAMHGEDLIGAELGLYQAESFCTILQVCKNVKTLVGVDLWEPYVDEIGGGRMVRDKKTIDFMYNTAVNYINNCGETDRADVYVMDSIEASKEFEDDHFDFVFFDSHLTAEQLTNELSAWSPKIKTGGLCIVHDFNRSETVEGITDFVKISGMQVEDSHYCGYDDTVIWKK